MAAFDTSAPAPFGAISVFRATTMIETALSRLSDWNRRRRTIRELNALTDAQLADIGLDGVAFDEVARKLHG